ncbi:vacuolar protein sorting-associated protein 13 [Calocera viscosa TUFC12733]|uniref:Vacuolar protein sorting-associated protein 13 n=1 Tax=Calocera viscosa (strain TUFC12733) TaxID=1330018 RepID=A0A167JE23_CALVF|nr:vacuolar protein sorting-associated protein 13 [Calocera viscosa TUFC12733]
MVLESVLQTFLNRFLAPYVENLNTSQMNFGIWSGEVKLRNLKLKREALDKFRLPVDVVEGYLGEFRLSVPWNNLRGKPVAVAIENVYLIALPAAETKVDAEEDDRRRQAAKQEKLENAELLRLRSGQEELSPEDEAKNQTFISQLSTRILNNLQITVKNVHIRYEDKLSVPEHPFAAGITLAGFKAVSTDGNWMETFIEDSLGAIHKLSKLESLAVYFDTDMTSMLGQGPEKLDAMIARQEQTPDHQYVLKPVTGEAKLVMSHRPTPENPRIDATVLFEEIGLNLDDNQWRDVLSVGELFHFYTRQYQYRKYRPPEEEFTANKSRALWKFAQTSLLAEVHDKHYQWNWEFFKNRRSERHKYVELFKKKSTQPSLLPPELEEFNDLERKLSYEDIRFYRSIARSQLRKERAELKAKQEEDKAAAPPAPAQPAAASGTWLGWIWGTNPSSAAPAAEEEPAPGLDDEQRKELYDAIEYTDKDVITQSIDLPRDVMKMRVSARLTRGTFALRRHGSDMISLVFDALSADLVQRPENMEAILALGGLSVYDSTLSTSVYPQIVRVKEQQRKAIDSDEHEEAGKQLGLEAETEDPFFFVKFEQNPLDERADSALTVRMRYMEIIYHRGYVEAIFDFLRPPPSQLESIGALIDVASTTLEGLQKETRAGLEYALKQHKTLDIRMDMNAPIIIIPEDISAKQCPHMVLDAGHIAIQSDLVEKSKLAEIDAKRSQQYSEEDYKQLESLMYDRFFLKLESAQLLIGPDLLSCMSALTSHSQGAVELHLVERINIDFSVQNCILPDAPFLTRFKVAGQLPELKVNVSNTKYQGLMRFLDIAIPRFGGGQESDRTQRPPARPVKPERAPAPISGIFAKPEGTAYVVDDAATDAGDGTDGADHEKFYEAEDVDPERQLEIKQHLFEFSFKVGKLQASLFKALPEQQDKLIADAVLEGFDLGFAQTKWSMLVDIVLRSVSMKMMETGAEPLQLVASQSVDERSSEELMRIKYTRVQKDSPEYMPVYEGVDQTIGVELSTFNFAVQPEPILTMYDFIMTTFVPSKAITRPTTPFSESPPDLLDLPPDLSGPTPAVPVPPAEPAPEHNPGKIKIRVKLTSIGLALINSVTSPIATISLSAADVALFLSGNGLRIGARLGNLTIVDDTDFAAVSPSFKQLLSIEGDNFADFSYETFDPNDKDTFPGYNSSVRLRAGSLKFNFVVEPLHRVYLFLIKFARLKALYDSATQAAVQRASEIQRMKFDVIVQTPILVLPKDATQSADALVVKLGEIVAKNTFGTDTSSINAGLFGIKVLSQLHDYPEEDQLEIIQDVDLSADVEQVENPDHDHEEPDVHLPAIDSHSQQPSNHGTKHPDTKVTLKISDIKVNLTQNQYLVLMSILQELPHVFASDEDVDEQIEEYAGAAETPMDSVSPEPQESESEQLLIDLSPELGVVAKSQGNGVVRLWTKMEVTLDLAALAVQLYDRKATRKEELKATGIAGFAMNGTSVRMKMMSDGSLEAEIVLTSLVMTNLRAGSTRFREMIPAAKHNGRQVMIHYTRAAGINPAAMAIVTVDSPQIIFAVDPVFALLDFFSDPIKPSKPEPPFGDMGSGPEVEAEQQPTTAGELSFRVNVVNAAIIVLDSDRDPSTQSIQLSIKEIMISKQAIIALNMQRLGMSLGRMDKASERVRFLDDIDVTLTMDSRATEGRQMTSIEATVQPIIFRASYRDINLITSIFTRAMELQDRSEAERAEKQRTMSKSGHISTTVQRKPSQGVATRKSHKTRASRSSRRSVSKRPQVLMAKEQLKATFDGFQLVLIGDIHELPLLHMDTKSFMFTAQDWSGDLKALGTVSTSTRYYNMTNSHWEPLLEPWTFSVKASRGDATSGIALSLLSKDRLEVNVTASFIDTALSAVAVINKEGDRLAKRNRGNDAPYLVQNRTGYRLHLWSDSVGRNQNPSEAVTIEDGQDKPWHFEDWRSLREHVSDTKRNSFAVQFEDRPWETLRHISVDSEGETSYVLKPKLNQISHRLLCEVIVENNVKVVIFRSTYKIQNYTQLPVELIIIDGNGKPASAVFKISPGDSCSLPIEAAVHNRIRLRPDPGFEYSWSSESFYWQDLMKRNARSIVCRAQNTSDAAFRFQAFTAFDKNDPVTRSYPKMTLTLRAPVELENLLPFDLKYRVFDKNTSQNWSSFLRHGGISPVHVVELSHLLLLSIDIQDAGVRPSEFAIINTDSEDFTIEKILPVTDQQNSRRDIYIHYYRYPDSGGAFKVQIYSPYILLNKTSLPLQLRSRGFLGGTRDVGQVIPPVAPSQVASPFMFSQGSDDRRNRCLLKIGASDWSKPLSFEAVKADTEVVILSPSGNEEMHVGMSYSEGLGKYKLTKVITVAPRFLIRNNLGMKVNFREHRSRDFISVEPGQRAALTSLRSGTSYKLVTFAYSGLNAEWSAPINIQDIGKVHFRLTPPDQVMRRHLIRADVLLEGSTIFIILNRETGAWPFAIENNSDYSITYCQVDGVRTGPDGEERPGTRRNPYEVMPHSRERYAWDQPAARDKYIKLIINGQDRNVDVMEMGALEPFKFPVSDRGSRAVSLDIRADGPTQTLVISNYDEIYSLYKPKRQSTSSSPLGSRDAGFEAVEEEAVVTFTINIQLEGIGLSVVTRKLQELVYVSLRGLDFQYTDSTTAQSVNVAFKWIQIDNQLYGGIFPIILYPTSIPHAGKELDVHPALQTSAIILKDKAHGVLFVKYASILLQSMTIELDEDFLYALIDFSKFRGGSWETEVQDVLIEQPGDIPDATELKGGLDMYFEILHLQPVALELSFMRTDRVNVDEKQSTRNPIAFFVNALTMALGNVNMAPVRLNALVIENMRSTVPVLQDRIVYHYQQEFFTQLYRILGSADLLGNPVGLFQNLSSGVADIFYEPYQGLIMHGNKELGIGIARGATSFVKKAVFGVSDSVTKVTSSIGKGLSAATFDVEFQNRRRVTLRRNKPKHALYGVTAGASAFASSVASGFEGLALKPLEGAETGGAVGFFKGIGKGLVGAVTKPVVGVLDLAANVSEGIRNTTTVFDQSDLDRVRLPRYVPPDGILVPYSEREALGQSWLKDVENGQFVDEQYVAHIDLRSQDEAVLISTIRILQIRISRLRVIFDIHLSELQTIALEPSGIQLVRQGGASGPFIPLPDQKSREWFFRQIEKIVTQFNSNRRN